MESKVSDIEKCRKIVEIEIPKEIVNEELDRAYEFIRKDAEMPGFRKGKVPRKILEQQHSNIAREHVLRKLIPFGYSQAIEKHNIEPVAKPEIRNVELVKNKPLHFEACVDVKPEFKIKRYKGIKVKKPEPQVTNEDVEQALNILRESYAEYKSVEDRPIKEGDYVIVNFKTQVKDKTIDKREKIWFYIEENKAKSNDVIKALIGAKVQEKAEVETTLPKDYFKKDYANKKALMKIEVEEIREKHLPNLDEEFLKNLGEYNTVEDLKEAISKDIAKRKQQEIKFEVERQLTDKLIELNPLDVPPAMVKNQIDELLKSAKTRLVHQGLKEEEVDQREEALRANLREDAEKQVKMYFLLNRIANEENIEIDETTLQQKLKQLADQNKTDPQKIKEYLAKNDSLEALKSQIKQEKTIEFLLDNAKVKKIK
jgi:trigger factor